jgi:cytochrome c oxidase accessory protein FixG
MASNTAPKQPNKFSDGSRKWVYPQRIKGQFDNIRRWTFIVLQAWMFITPWIYWHGLPLVQVDMSERRMFVFGGIYTAQDTVFLFLSILASAFVLFLITALWGRVWCGYACPQTVFLDGWVHRIEGYIEGSRGKRMALDKKPWNAEKARKKILKHAIFMLLAAFVSMSIVSWFADTVSLWTGQGTWPQYGAVAFLTAAWYADFAWFREQFCNYLCPYARFQGALSGPNSFTVSYDAVRGEPRKKGKRKEGDSSAGACIDCNKCVAVCPQGIDIRDGFQLECIACTRCIDACTSVLGKLNQPTLVRYSTVNLDKGAKSHKWVRFRTVLYSLLLLGIGGTFTTLLASRHEIQGTVSRTPGTLFTIDDDGWIRNTYLVRVVNNHPGEPSTFELSVEGLPNAQVIAPPVTLPQAEAMTVPLVVRIPPDSDVARTAPMEVMIKAPHDTISLNATFKTNRSTGG